MDMNEWNQVRGRWTVKCIDNACAQWGGFHEPERAADGYTFITHADRNGARWTRPCVAPVASFAQMDAVAVAVDAFVQTGGHLCSNIDYPPGPGARPRRKAVR